MSKVEEEKENGYRNKSNVYKFPRVKLESDQVTPSLWNLASLMFGNSLTHVFCNTQQQNTYTYKTIITQAWHLYGHDLDSRLG